MFNWLCSYFQGNNYWISIVDHNCCIWTIQMYLIMFTLGGCSGIILSNNCIDISLHDSYYVVSHFHIVLSLGTILSIIIGICYYI